MASISGSPCAACKFLRRRCTAECMFAPYFPPDQPQKFANVHKIFGASNVTKLLNELPQQQREDAVNSLAFEAEARVKDPVYGCVGAISVLQRQVLQLQKELAVARSELARYTGTGMSTGPPQALPMVSSAVSSLGVGIALPGPTSREQMAARKQLLELAREENFTREQLFESYARIGGGGQFDVNTLAALGYSGVLHSQLPSYNPHSRPGSGSDGGSASSSVGASGSQLGHISPP